MDREQGGHAPPLEPPGAGAGRVCKQCGTPIQGGATFCTNCGANVPAAPLSFDALPEWWKRAAAGLLGTAVLGVLISSFWSADAPVIPDEPEVGTTTDSRSEATSAGASRAPVSRPKRTYSAAPREEEPSPLGDWSARTEASPMGDATTVYLDLRATDSPEGRGALSYAPQLSFTCTGNEIKAYVFVRAPRQVGQSGYATARIRFDTLEPQTLRMEISVEEDALFFEKPTSVLKEMLGHEQMLFGYTPRGFEEVVTGFDLRGVDEAVKSLVAGCNLPELEGKEQAAGDSAKANP